MLRNGILALAGSLAVATAAHAGLVQLKTTKAGFTGAVQNIQTSTFVETDFNPEALPGDSITGLEIPTLGATLSGGGSLRTGDLNGRHAVDENGGEDTNGVFIEGGTSALQISFATAVQAFAFWGVDIGDFDCTGCTTSSTVIRVELFDSNNDSLGSFDDELPTSSTSGDSRFFGFVGSATDAISRVVITNLTVSSAPGSTAPPAAADGQGFSRFMIGDAIPGGGGGPVPEPGTLALLGIGLLAGVGRVRRK